MSIKVFIFGNRRFYEEFTCMVFIWPFEAVLFSFSPFSNLIPQYTKESTVFSIPLEHRNCPWFIYIATNCLASIFWGRIVFKFVVLSVLNQFDRLKLQILSYKLDVHIDDFFAVGWTDNNVVKRAMSWQIKIIW